MESVLGGTRVAGGSPVTTDLYDKEMGKVHLLLEQYQLSHPVKGRNWMQTDVMRSENKNKGRGVRIWKMLKTVGVCVCVYLKMEQMTDKDRPGIMNCLLLSPLLNGVANLWVYQSGVQGQGRCSRSRLLTSGPRYRNRVHDRSKRFLMGSLRVCDLLINQRRRFESKATVSWPQRHRPF